MNMLCSLLILMSYSFFFRPSASSTYPTNNLPRIFYFFTSKSLYLPSSLDFFSSRWYILTFGVSELLHFPSSPIVSCSLPFFFFFFFFYLYFFLRHYLTCSSFYLAHGPHDPFIYSHDCTCRALFSICLSFAPHQSSIIHTYMYVYISFIRKIAIEDIKQKTVMIHDIHCIFVFCFNTKSRYLVDKCY